MSQASDDDRRFVWHPFTQMREWCAGEPLIIIEADGAILRDESGREYLDGNASIWTNVHGHRQPEMDAAIRAQLDRVAHTSFLGAGNDTAASYARELIRAFTQGDDQRGWRVFFSDDGSTAIEAGLKMIHQARCERGESRRTVYLSLARGYHGDTVGAMSLGHSSVFHSAYRGLLFESREVMSPACYRCPFNNARPMRGSDARLTRQCKMECIGEMERALDAAGDTASAVVLEPHIQGAAGMAMHPPEYLPRVAHMCRERGVWLMLDEVLTGFGRTGPLFACQRDHVTPDIVALGKGITGGYLPLAATIASEEIFHAFDSTTFFHGHSYSGNQLGCAAARASLALLHTAHDEAHRANHNLALTAAARRFWQHPNVGDVRITGQICAIELVADFDTRTPLPAENRTGARVCQAARHHGLLTRNIGDILILMLPLCATPAQIEHAVEALDRGLREVLAPG